MDATAAPTDADPCRVIEGDCLAVLPTLGAGSFDAVLTDPPYGMRCNTNSRRFTGGVRATRPVEGRADWPEVRGDDRPFDPTPWLSFPKVVLWGANHYAARLPVGTTLVWLKRADPHFGTFLSDAEIGWMKGGHGVYCHRKLFPPTSRIKEGGGYSLHPNGRAVHPMQKPVCLMRWCIRRLKLPPGSLILDPYAGSGTTGVAAVLEGMRCILIEDQSAYAATARRRVAEAVAGRGLFAGVS